MGDFVKVPLVTIGDSAFPSYTWLLKCYNEGTRDNQKRHFNSKLCGARVVTENCYGILKGSYIILSREDNLIVRNYGVVHASQLMYQT